MYGVFLFALLVKGPNPFPGAKPLAEPWAASKGLWYVYPASKEPAWAPSLNVCRGITVVQLSEKQKCIASRPMAKSKGVLKATLTLGLGTFSAGLIVCCDRETSKGLSFELFRDPGSLVIQDINSGRQLWKKEYIRVIPYQAYSIEIQIYNGKAWAILRKESSGEILCQSSPQKLPEISLNRYWGFITRGGPARFRCVRWQDTPGEEGPLTFAKRGRLRRKWRPVGNGEWIELEALDDQVYSVWQTKQVEDTRFVLLKKQELEGTWRAKVRILPGGHAAGIAVHTDQNGRGGVELFLGGSWGKGSLVVALNGKKLWQSPEGKWRYSDTYVLELDLEGKLLQGRLLSDGEEKIITESPTIPVKLKGGFFALFCKNSCCIFSDFGPLGER